MLVASSNFLVPNGTFIVELVAFLLVLYILSRFLPRIQAAVDARKQIISQAIVDAEEAKQAKEQAEEERQRIVAEARTQARSVVEEANKMADQARNEKREQAEAEYDRIVSAAQAEVDAQARRAEAELRQQAADLAITVAEKVIGEGIDRDAQSALINRTIDEVAAGSTSGGNA